MSLTVAQLQATIGLDATGLTQGIARAQARIAELIASAKQTNAAMLGTERAMVAAGASTNSFGQAMALAAERTLSFKDSQRQQNAFTRELTATHARLAEVLGGEGAIAAEVAAKYSTLTNVERAQLIAAKEQVAAIQAKVKAQAEWESASLAAAAKAARTAELEAAAVVKAKEQEIAAAGKAALANAAASEAAVRAAEAEVAADIKAALAAGQVAAAEKGRAAATEEAAAASRASGFAGTGLLVGVGVAAALGESVKASIEFNKAMANVGSLIPGNVARLGELKVAVQNLAMETGKDTKEIATGAYQIISSFGDTADTAKDLAINTKLAIGGVADVGKTIGLTAAVTKTYGDHSAEAVQHVADLATMTVRLGHTTLPELNASIGAVAPLASQLNINMETLFGTLATGSGVTGNMSRVSTQLRGVLAGFANPTKAMVELFNRVGVSSGKALIEQRGLAGAIKLVADESERTDTPLQKYFHRIEATTLAIALAGPQAKTLTDKIEKMGHAAGAADQALKAQQTGIGALGTEWAKFNQTLKVTEERFGDMVGPTGTAMLGFINRFITAVHKAGEATGKWASTPMGPSLTGYSDGKPTPALTNTAENWAQLSLGAKGRSSLRERSYGPAIPAGLGMSAAGGATKEQLDAHQRILDDIEAAAFARKRQEAVQYNGEISKQVAALDLYHKKWNELTGGQQKSTLALLANQKAEDASKNAVKAHQDAVDAVAKAEQKAADERRKAAEERAKEDQKAKDYIRQQQLEIRANTMAIGTPRQQFNEDHPEFRTKAAQQRAFDIHQWNLHTAAVKADSEAVRQAENAANEAMNAQLKQAQLDADSEKAKRKYGEVNRESLALDSQWNAHYADLAPNQQRIIDQLFQLTAAKKLQNDQDKAFEEDAQRRIKQHDDEVQRIDREKQAMIDLGKVAADRAKADRKEKDDAQARAMEERFKEAFQKQHDALVGYANDFASVFTQAFRDVADGSKSFFTSIVQGFEHMLQEMALKYLESKIANLFFGLLNNAFGGTDPLAVPSAGEAANMFGLSARASGGPVVPGQQYIVGERGQELFTPNVPGTITPHGQLAGAGGPTVNIHFNIQTPDVSGFQRTQGQLMADAHRQAENWSKRNNG